MADNPGTPRPILNYRRRSTAAKRPPSVVPVAGVIVLVSLALLPLMLVLFYPVAKRLPIGWDTLVHLGFADHPDLVLGLFSSGDFGRPTDFDTAWVAVEHGRHWIDIELDLESQSCRLIDEEVPGPSQPFGGPAIAELWTKQGRITTPQQAEVAAQAVREKLRTFSPDRLPPDYTHDWRGQVPGCFYDMAGTYFGEPDELRIWLPWYTVYLVPVWLALSYLFARRMLRRHRRAIREATVGLGVVSEPPLFAGK